MSYLVDTDVLVDVSRNTAGAISFLDAVGNDWTPSAMTVLELISGAKNQREVDLIDRLIEVFETNPVGEAIGRRAMNSQDAISCRRIVLKLSEAAD